MWTFPCVHCSKFIHVMPITWLSTLAATRRVRKNWKLWYEKVNSKHTISIKLRIYFVSNRTISIHEPYEIYEFVHSNSASFHGKMKTSLKSQIFALRAQQRIFFFVETSLRKSNNKWVSERDHEDVNNRQQQSWTWQSFFFFFLFDHFACSSAKKNTSKPYN